MLEIESVGSNLIDFNSDLPSSQHSRHPSQHFHQEPEYVNGDIPNPRKSSNRDPFDMSKTKINHNFLLIFKTIFKKFLGPFATNPPTNIPDVIKAQLEQEEWYHGAVSREAAERLLQNVSFQFHEKK